MSRQRPATSPAAAAISKLDFEFTIKLGYQSFVLDSWAIKCAGHYWRCYMKIYLGVSKFDLRMFPHLNSDS